MNMYLHEDRYWIVHKEFREFSLNAESMGNQSQRITHGGQTSQRESQP